MAELRFLAAGFLGHQFRMRLHVRQHLGAERQIAAQVVQEILGGRGQLGCIGAVVFLCVVQQQVALHEIAGVQAARQHQHDRQQADPEDEAPQVDADHGAVLQ